jgi:hypothetical protein
MRVPMLRRLSPGLSPHSPVRACAVSLETVGSSQFTRLAGDGCSPGVRRRSMPGGIGSLKRRGNNGTFLHRADDSIPGAVRVSRVGARPAPGGVH